MMIIFNSLYYISKIKIRYTAHLQELPRNEDVFTWEPYRKKIEGAIVVFGITLFKNFIIFAFF